jgi:hypothetical protein
MRRKQVADAPRTDAARASTRDRRWLFRESWVLLLGLVCFGAGGLTFLWGAMPRGWTGLLRLALLLGIVLLVGGLVGPLISRALMRPAARATHKAGVTAREIATSARDESA